VVVLLRCDTFQRHCCDTGVHINYLTLTDLISFSIICLICCMLRCYAVIIVHEIVFSVVFVVYKNSVSTLLLPTRLTNGYGL